MDVTICVAAVCNIGVIFGASDRMLTAGDVEFEPEQSKIIPVSNSIAAMVAGDASLQTEILRQVLSAVGKRVTAEPQRWWLVKEVADLYFKSYSRIRRSRGEASILWPLNLNRTSFLTQQGTMDSSLVRQLASELVNYKMPEIQAIITGVDPSGPHIYVIENEGISCRDSAGFAAIGIGYWHANSQFMFARHTTSKPMPETLLLTYAAKRRAEVAPGVGEGTDMFTIGPQVGSYGPVSDDVMKNLGLIYERIMKRTKKSLERSNREVTEYVEEITKRAAAATQTSAAEPSVPEGGLASGNEPPETAQPESPAAETGSEEQN